MIVEMVFRDENNDKIVRRTFVEGKDLHLVYNGEKLRYMKVDHIEYGVNLKERQSIKIYPSHKSLSVSGPKTKDVTFDGSIY